MGRGSAAAEFWVGQGGERRGRPPAVCSARTNAVQAGKTRRPEGLGGKGPLAALLVGHRPLRVCSLLAPCQSNPSLPNRTPPHFQTGSNKGDNRGVRKTKERVAGPFPRSTDRRRAQSAPKPTLLRHEDLSRHHPQTPSPDLRIGSVAGNQPRIRPGTFPLARHRRVVRHLTVCETVRHQFIGHAARLGRSIGVLSAWWRRLTRIACHRSIGVGQGDRPPGTTLVSGTSRNAAPAQGSGGHRRIPDSHGWQFGGDRPNDQHG